MTFIPKPKVSHPGLPRNELGLTRRDYEGARRVRMAGMAQGRVRHAGRTYDRAGRASRSAPLHHQFNNNNCGAWRRGWLLPTTVGIPTVRKVKAQI